MPLYWIQWSNHKGDVSENIIILKYNNKYLYFEHSVVGVMDTGELIGGNMENIHVNVFGGA